MSELTAYLKEQIAKFQKKSKRPALSAFKAHGDYWHAEWTNNAEDRDAEFFTGKALKDYEARVDMGLTPYPDLWVWHGGEAVKIGKSTQISTVEKDGVVIMSAVGTFDDNPRALAAKAFYNESKEIHGMSHGFTYPAARKQGRVYNQFNTFELTVLPIEAAANPYTAFDSKEYEEANMKQEKFDYYVKVFGKDEAEKIKSEMEGKAATLSQIAEYKEFFSVSDATEDKDEKEHNHSHGNEEVETALKAVVGDIIPEMGEIAEMQLGMAKKVKEQSLTITALLDANKAMKKQIADIQAELKAKPRAASEAEDTEIEDEDAPDMKKKFQDKEAGEKDSFWGDLLEKERK